MVLGTLLCSVMISCEKENTDFSVKVMERPVTTEVSVNYTGNRAPLKPLNFIKLPVGDIQPKGWLKKYLLLQKEGLTGRLGEISAWLEKENNAWLMSGGNHGWEEVPYWLKGYGNLAYILKDSAMIAETRVWIEAAIASQREDGYFGPVNERNGRKEFRFLEHLCPLSEVQLHPEEHATECLPLPHLGPFLDRGHCLSEVLLGWRIHREPAQRDYGQRTIHAPLQASAHHYAHQPGLSAEYPSQL